MSTTIKKYRLKKGLTQENLANLLNVSKSTIGMWETGARKPDIIKLKKLAVILACPVATLAFIHRLRPPRLHSLLH